MASSKLCPQCGKRQEVEEGAAAKSQCQVCGYRWKRRRAETEQTINPGSASRAQGAKKKKSQSESAADRQWSPKYFLVGSILASLMLVVCVVLPLLFYWQNQAALQQQYEALKDSQKVAEAQEQWVARGKDSVPHLLRALDDDSIPKQPIVEIFGKLGDQASEAVSPLSELLDDPRQPVRVAAAGALGRIGPPANSVVSALMRKAEQSDGPTQLAAIRALHQLKGPQQVMPLLKSMLTSPDAKAHAIAISVAESLENVAEPLLDELLRLLQRQSRSEQLATCRVIQRTRPQSPEVLEAVKQIVQDPDLNIERRREAVELLGKMGSPAVPVLIQAIEIGPLLQASAKALGDIGDPAGLPGLFRALERLDEWESSQRGAAIRNQLNQPVTTITERNSAGEVLSQRQYGQHQSTGNIASRAADLDDPLGRQMASISSSTDDGRELIRTALRKLGVDGEEQLKAAKLKIDRQGLGAKIGSWKKIRVLEAPDDLRVQRLQLSANGRWLAALATVWSEPQETRTVLIWDLATGALSYRSERQEERLSVLRLSPDGQRVAYASDTTIHIWNQQLKSVERTITPQLSQRYSTIQDVAFADDQTLAALSSDSRFRRWRISEGDLLAELKLPWSIQSAQFLPDPSMAIVTGSDGRGSSLDSKVVSVTGGDPVMQFSAWRIQITPVFSVDGTLIAQVGGLDQDEVGIHSVVMRRTISQFATTPRGTTEPKNELSAVAIHPEKDVVLTGNRSGLVQFWRIDNGHWVQEFQAHPTPISALLLTHDGRFLLTAGKEPGVTIWQVSGE